MALCPNCGEDNPDRARFCLNCATALTAPEPEQQAEERKTVTVLFCDLVGFTARSDQADPKMSGRRCVPSINCSGGRSNASAARSRSSSATPSWPYSAPR